MDHYMQDCYNGKISKVLWIHVATGLYCLANFKVLQIPIGLFDYMTSLKVHVYRLWTVHMSPVGLLRHNELGTKFVQIAPGYGIPLNNTI